MTFEFSENAKLVRRIVYEQFLEKGSCDGVGDLLAHSGLDIRTYEQTLAELERGLMVMCPPGTVDIAKCPPWTNIPTRHRIEIDGRRIGYAGCLLEAVNSPYCYPGKEVTLRSSCPQTGQDLLLRYRGNELLETNLPGIVGHVGLDPSIWSDNWFKGCANNNFFASSEAVSDWEAAHPDLQGVLLTLDQLKVFARYENRLDYERGADADNPSARTASSMFGDFDVTVPASWKQ